MVREEKLIIRDLTFDCRVAGNPEDQLILLLHGFPESNFMWLDLMKDLSALGYYCVAPNLRGYSAGARPKGKAHYSMAKLSQDIIDISQKLNKPKFHLIGHDWGSGIGWQVVHDHPQAVLTWSALSVPHVQSFFNAILNDKDQQVKSRYIKMFQLPFLPEMKMKSKHFKILRQLWDAQSEEEIEDYITILKGKGALTAVLNYYRANYKTIKSARTEQVMGDIHVPSIFIWGNKDIAVGRYAVEGSHAFMKREYNFVEVDGGHWLVQSNYKEVKEAITELLNNSK